MNVRQQFSVKFNYDVVFTRDLFAPDNHTLAEVRNCANAGIRVSSFALIEDYFYLGLVNFVEEMARVSRGVAAYCSTDEIGNLVFDSFVGGRRKRRYDG